jgi:hypothetical protein
MDLLPHIEGIAHHPAHGKPVSAEMQFAGAK